MDKISRKGLIDLLALPVAASALAATASVAEAAADDSGGTKKTYKYVAKSAKAGQICGNCGSFVAPAGCQIVKGKIAKNGWCIAWHKKS